jgi:hypothetical protein
MHSSGALASLVRRSGARVAGTRPVFRCEGTQPGPACGAIGASFLVRARLAGVS